MRYLDIWKEFKFTDVAKEDMKRYVIEMALLNETIKGDPEWRVFYSAKSKHTLRGARKEFWVWVNRKWDFTSDRPVFRIYDTKKNEVVG